MKCAEGGDGCTALGSSTTFGLPFGGANYRAPYTRARWLESNRATPHRPSACPPETSSRR